MLSVRAGGPEGHAAQGFDTASAPRYKNTPMADAHVNGIRLFWEQHGDSGAPLVMVHGSWGDHHNWDAVVPELAKSFRVMTYDRRGHSQSERPAGQGSLDEDVADLAELIGSNGLAPVHVIGNSGGAIVSLKLAAFRPELLASLVVHEPPLDRKSTRLNSSHHGISYA